METPPPRRAWHALPRAEVLAALASEEAGLSDDEARRRRTLCGPNELRDVARPRVLELLTGQFRSLMTAVLLVAAAISFAAGDSFDALVVLAILLFNAIVGFTQEWRAHRALAALQRLAVPAVRLRRGGRAVSASALDVVPGDVLLLEAGNSVPADCRLLVTVDLRVQEAALTGESTSVDKDAEACVPASAPPSDQPTMAFMGTVVVHGRGEGVVVATGMATELGRIALLLQSVGRRATPLQRRLDRLGRLLAGAALGIVSAIVAFGFARGDDPTNLVLTGLSMAVAAVPEGLPTVVTIALALGTRRLLRRRAHIRHPPAVETLGAVTVICTDKTGTLTENRMAVAALEVAGYRATEPIPNGAPPSARSAVALLLAGGALCNDATPPQGDPTEVALVVAADAAGLAQEDLQRACPRVAELPFDAHRKRMTTIHRDARDASFRGGPLGAALRSLGDPTFLAFTKGAVDELVAVCGQVWMGAAALPLDDAGRARIAADSDRLAADGLRVLGFALRPLATVPLPGRPEAVEHDLIFLGLVGLADPPRPGSATAVQSCREAGIRPVMITGDHPLTARHIARAVGIASDEVLTGRDLDRLSVADLAARVDDVAVYARVSPEHKLAIVDALQQRGHVVAMTGDGVNDAPALRKADVGVAMGRSGTDVAREAADMVLLDDDFATIVAAVEEGRVIYDNIRKFVRYLIASNVAELWVMLLAPIVGMPLPLLPVQVLWINLVTDGPAALALAGEPAEPATMRRPPYPPAESILARGLGWHVVWVGWLMALVSLAAGLSVWSGTGTAWRSMIFTTLVLAQMANVLALRSEREPLHRLGFLSNPPLLLAVTLTLGLQLAVLYVPALQAVFGTESLSWAQLGLCAFLAACVFVAVELQKWLQRMIHSPRRQSSLTH